MKRAPVLAAAMLVAAAIGTAGYVGSGRNGDCGSGRASDPIDPISELPKGPWAWVSTAPYVGAPSHFGHTLFILGADSSPVSACG